ncbi:MAG: methyltransferase domain-containing protein [Syntrophales bacterium]
MGDEYLASGFSDVDAAGDTTAYGQCLSLLDSLPYFRRTKERSYELLRLSAGMTVLEVGCGLGDDALRMAERVAPGGKVVGVDASARMIAAARARLAAHPQVELHRADARRLPFRDASFERCRVDRTLQHIRHPGQVLREMARALKPGGLLLAYDNDWGTFSISGGDDECTRIMETLWGDSFANRWIGRYLKRYFREAGLAEVTVAPSVCVLDDFALADRVYNLRQTAERAVEGGRVTPAVAARWLADLEAQSRAGGFLCTLTAFTVVGTKPGPGTTP